MIEELRKELNEDQMDLSKSYGFKNKTTRKVTMKFQKNDFILPNVFVWTNQVLQSDTDARQDLKAVFESKKPILEKVDKTPAPYNIQASFDTQIANIKNTSIDVKSLTVAHESFFLYDNENMITDT